MTTREEHLALEINSPAQAALDEIERLQKAYDSRGSEMDSMRMVLAETQKRNEDRCAEIAQLRAVITYMKEHAHNPDVIRLTAHRALELKAS